VVTEKLDEQNLKRMRHPAYSPDRSPCDFFLCGYLKDKVIDKQYTTPEELSAEVTTILSGIPSDLTSRVFATGRLVYLSQTGGDRIRGLPDDGSRRWVLSYLLSESRSSSSFGSSRGLSRTGYAFHLCVFHRQIDHDSRNFVTSPLFFFLALCTYILVLDFPFSFSIGC
jgi:hypothetical protein